MPRPKKTQPSPTDEKVTLILQLKDMLSSLSIEEKQAILGIEIPKDNPVSRNTKANFTLGPRANTFIESEDFNENKEDTAIDKLLWAKKKPTKRKQRTTLVESTCAKCDKVETVSSSITMRKDDTQRLEHVCKTCLSKKG